MKSIFTKTYVYLTFLAFFIFIVVAVLVDNIFERADINRFQSQADLEARYISLQLQAVPKSTWAEWVANYRTTLPFVVRLQKSTQISPDKESAFNIDDDGTWTLHHKIEGTDKVLILSEVDESIGDIESDDWLEFFVPVAAIFIALAIAMYILSQKIARPINELVSAAQKIREGNLKARVNERVAYPISELASSFNSMSSQLEKTLAEQKILVGAMPHELRSPLARARFALDTSRQLESVELLHQRIEKIDGYLQDLEDISDDTMTLARLIYQQQVDYENFHVENLIYEITEHYRGLTQKNLSWQCNGDTSLSANQSLIGMVIRNLLENANNYGKQEIKITAFQLEEDRVLIRVEDDGPGVPEKNRKDIFKAYYRVDKSRTRATGGVGLGLALVDLIVRKHNGYIEVGESEQLKGAKFDIYLPKRNRSNS